MSDETPTYNRRGSGELEGEKLTNYRLKSLEECVERLTEQVSANNSVLGEINARLAVGAERHSTYDKRLESLEGDRRWTVMGILTAVAALAWQALTAFAGKHGMFLVAALLLSGCFMERGSPPPVVCGPACATLVGIGTYVVWAGSAAVSAGLLAVVASFFPWTSFLVVFRNLFAEVIALGFAAILLGSAFIWLGDHIWLVAVVCGLVLAWLGYRYRGLVLALFAAAVKHG